MVDDDDSDDDDDVRWPKACLPASLMAKGRVMMMMVMKKPTSSMAKGLPANQFDGQKFASRTTLLGLLFSTLEQDGNTYGNSLKNRSPTNGRDCYCLPFKWALLLFGSAFLHC